MLKCEDATKFIDVVAQASREEETANAVLVTRLRTLSSFFSILADLKNNHAFTGLAHVIGAIMTVLSRLPPLSIVTDSKVRTKIMQVRRELADLMVILKNSLEPILEENYEQFYLFIQRAYEVFTKIEMLSVEFLSSMPPTEMVDH